MPDDKLYTTPEDMLAVYEALQGQGRYMFAATFGNVHGHYKPGAVKLRPDILKDGQEAVISKYGQEAEFDLVFHGGSGSPVDQIRETLGYGVIKMNIDTDTQYAFTRPIADHIIKNYDGVLMVDGDIGNKKAYDPRAYLKKAEEGMAARIGRACDDLCSSGKSIFKRKSTSPICRVSLPKLGREINSTRNLGIFLLRDISSGKHYLHTMNYTPSLVTILSLFLWGCGKDPITVQKNVPKDYEGQHLRWTLPDGWENVEVDNNMQMAAFSINDGDQNYKFTISTFSGGGGTDLDNLNRWFGQLGKPPANITVLANYRKNRFFWNTYLSVLRFNRC